MKRINWIDLVSNEMPIDDAIKILEQLLEADISEKEKECIKEKLKTCQQRSNK